MSFPRPLVRRRRFQPSLIRLEGRALMAHAGTLDTTFGGGLGYYVGNITLTQSATLDNPLNQTSVALEADNSIVVGIPDSTTSGVETFAVEHLTAAGALDTSFGNAGKADVILPSGYTTNENAFKVLVDSSGNIIVVGTIFAASGSSVPTEALVARFTANGTPDATFGTGGGVTIPEATLGALYGAAVQADGAVDVLGIDSVVQLTSTGALDPTFGTDGVATLGINSGGNSSAIAVQSNGQIVVLGYDSVQVGVNTDQAAPVLIRLNTNGSIDSSLGQSGITASGIGIPDGGGLLIEPDGSFVVLGFHTSGNLDDVTTVARINADGSLGTSVPLTGINEMAYQFALTSDGDVVLAGLFNASSGFGALRLTPQLTPDLTFGQRGFATVAVPTGPGGFPIYDPQAIAVTSNNQIIVVGANPSTNSFGGAIVPTNYIVASLNSLPSISTPGDYNGDGLSDPAIYLTGPGEFAIQDSTGKTSGEIVPFGSPGQGNSIPAPGDYYGTGADDLAVYLPASGEFAVQDPTGQTAGETVQLGPVGVDASIPAPGDYFGDGLTDFAVYIPATGSFAIQDPSNLAQGVQVQFGSPGIGNTIPVPGDYYGTGRDDIAVYLPAFGEFAILDPTGQTAGEVVPFGMPGMGQSIPMPGDYDGSGKTELAVYVPSQGMFYYRPANGGPDVAVQLGTAGTAQTWPMQGNYTSPNMTDLGVYVTASGKFAYVTGTGPGPTEQFGTPGAGSTVPVTAVVLSPFPGTAVRSGQAYSFDTSSILGEPDALDFVPDLASKKAKPGGSSAS